MKPDSKWHRLATAAVAIAAAAPSGCLPPQFFPLIVLADAVEGHRDPNLDTGPDTTNFQNGPVVPADSKEPVVPVDSKEQVVLVVSNEQAVLVVSNAPVVSVDLPQGLRRVGGYGDRDIEKSISKAIARNDALGNLVHVSVNSVNGVVLLTGEAPAKAMHGDILEIVHSTNNVRQVVDEIRAEYPSYRLTRETDLWITRQIEARLKAIDIRKPTHIKVHTANSVVYLMGLVSPADAQAATDVATRIAGVTLVKRVFEYVD